MTLVEDFCSSNGITLLRTKLARVCRDKGLRYGGTKRDILTRINGYFEIHPDELVKELFVARDSNNVDKKEKTEKCERKKKFVLDRMLSPVSGDDLKYDTKFDTSALVSDINNINCECFGDETQKTSGSTERIVCDVLHKNNINDACSSKSIIKAYLQSDNLTKNSITKDDGFYYIHHIYGSHAFPDFIIFLVLDNHIVAYMCLEVKSGKKNIKWNDGIPKKGCMYVYIDTYVKKTIILSSHDLISDAKELELINEMYVEQVKLNKKYRTLLKESVFYPVVRGGSSQKVKVDLFDKELLNQVFISTFNNTFNCNVCESAESDADGEYRACVTQIQNMTLESTGRRAISLFSGAGGDTQGLHDAGVDVVGFVEIDETAKQTHLANFPECAFLGGDICEIKEPELQPYVNKIDFLFGGFPCQSFSHGGNKSATDPRGQLYKQFIRVTNIIKPSIILGENVKGILSRKTETNELFVDRIINEFKDIGYTIKYKLLSCENFGVPQLRKRVIFVGVKDSLNIDMDTIVLPEHHSDPNSRVKTIRSISEFSLKNALKVEKSKFIDMIPENKIITNDGDPVEVSGSVPTNLTKCYNETASVKNSAFDISFAKRKGGNFSCVVDVDGPTCTILCTYNRMPRLFMPMGQGSDLYFRPFTIGELKQIQGFPIDYEFVGTEMAVIKQIGNAVPPVVVTEVVKYLLPFI